MEWVEISGNTILEQVSIHPQTQSVTTRLSHALLPGKPKVLNLLTVLIRSDLRIRYDLSEEI